MPRIDRFEHFWQPSGREAAPLCYLPAAPSGQMQQCHRYDSDRLPSGLWQETFNSDSEIYGGANVGNLGAAIPASKGRLRLLIPANGFLVLQHR
jgi:Alpha amylase, C-terminal all-beta domain